MAKVAFFKCGWWAAEIWRHSSPCCSLPVNPALINHTNSLTMFVGNLERNVWAPLQRCYWDPLRSTLFGLFKIGENVGGGIDRRRSRSTIHPWIGFLFFQNKSTEFLVKLTIDVTVNTCRFTCWSRIRKHHSDFDRPTKLHIISAVYTIIVVFFVVAVLYIIVLYDILYRLY